MNQHHPIDDLFSRKLGNYVSETPMHLWEKIDQKRGWKHKLLNQLHLHKQGLMLALSVILLLSVTGWHFSKSETPALGSLPVPLAIAQNSAPSTESVEAKSSMEPPAIPEIAVLETSGQTKQTAVVASDIKQRAIAPISENTSNTSEIPAEEFESKEISANYSGATASEPLPKGPHMRSEEPDNGTGLKMQQLTALATLSPTLEEDRFLGLFKPEPKCAKFKHGQWFLYLDMLASPDVPIRSLKAKNNLYYNYVQNREQTESLEFSYSVGFRLSAVSGFGMAIRTGLNYSQINEQFNYYNENEERIIIDNTYGPNGEIIGTDTTIVTGVRHKVSHNKFQIVDLPLILGYEREYRKFIFTVNAGAHINLYFESDGDFLSPELEPISFSSNDPDALRAFRNHLGVGWYGSLGVQYKLSPRFNLMFEPYFKMYPKGFSRSQYIVEQQYLSTGFSIGIRQRI